jgi:hypothetical protein
MGNKFIRAPLASLGKVDNLQRHKFGQLIPFAPDKSKLGTHDVESCNHRLNVFRIENEITREGGARYGGPPIALQAGARTVSQPPTPAETPSVIKYCLRDVKGQRQFFGMTMFAIRHRLLYPVDLKILARLAQPPPPRNVPRQRVRAPSVS